MDTMRVQNTFSGTFFVHCAPLLGTYRNLSRSLIESFVWPVQDNGTGTEEGPIKTQTYNPNQKSTWDIAGTNGHPAKHLDIAL